MKITTGKLMDRLKRTSDLSGFFERYQDNMICETVGEYLRAVMEEKGVKPAELVRATRMGNYVYRVLHDGRNVSRNTLITIAPGLPMTLEEAQTLLRVMGRNDLVRQDGIHPDGENALVHPFVAVSLFLIGRKRPVNGKLRNRNKEEMER